MENQTEEATGEDMETGFMEGIVGVTIAYSVLQVDLNSISVFMHLYPYNPCTNS